MGVAAKKKKTSTPSGSSAGGLVLLLAAVIACASFFGGIRYQQAQSARPVAATAPRGLPIDRPVRPAPARFPADTCLPDTKEMLASGPIDFATFSPGRDLMRFDDPRVWFESDHVAGHEEDDHTVHRCVEEPLRRLVTLMGQRQARLKVFDGYRPMGVHLTKSLHREGRAIDIASDELSLEDLAKLCWAAGFDWVFFENSARGGAHVHASVRRPQAATPDRPVTAAPATNSATMDNAE